MSNTDLESVDEPGLSRVLGEHHHDDRLDVATGISARESLRVLGRCLRLLATVKWLFTARFLLRLGLVFPGLLLPWVSKIIIDNVLLGKSLEDNEVPYPPFMHPILEFLAGMSPLEIMFAISVGYVVGVIIFGTRTRAVGDLGGETNWGQDETALAERRISDFYSSAAGLWAMAEFWVTVRLNQYIANNLRTRLFQRLTRLPMPILSDKRTGDSIYRVLYDTSIVPEACDDMTLKIFFAALMTAINVYLINYSYGAIAPQLVIISLCVLPAVLILSLPAAGLLRRVNESKRSAGSATTNAMEETVGNIDAVQSLGGMNRETEKFDRSSRESYFRERVAQLVQLAIYITVGTAAAASAVYVVIIITDRIILGDMSPGDFGVLYGMYFNIMNGAYELGWLWLLLQPKVAPARRVFFFIDYESDDDRKGGEQLQGIERDVQIDHVSYHYPDGRPALKDVSLNMEVGQVVALMGPSGAGKTSLAYLLPGFLTPSEGRVMIDGKDLASLDIDSVRSQIAYVFQEHLLLAESIRDNLLLANSSATAQEMDEALELAGCKEFIAEMSQGLDTVLGRSGNTLSVGQQQRLCIARGLLRDARILILDEPTAALDPEAEQHLVRSLEALAKDRLVVMIAHRLSTVRSADQIVFMADGEIVERGTHDELIHLDGGQYRAYVGADS